MDTDDLSEMAYEILRIAEHANHILTLELAVLSRHFRSEDEYLAAVRRRIHNIREGAADFVESWGIQDEISTAQLCTVLSAIDNHILKTLDTPMQTRGIEPR